jgi:hypothetical protein
MVAELGAMECGFAAVDYFTFDAVAVDAVATLAPMRVEKAADPFFARARAAGESVGE